MGRRRNPRISKKEVAKKALRRILASSRGYVPSIPGLIMILGDYLEDGVISGVFMGIPYVPFIGERI